MTVHGMHREVSTEIGVDPAVVYALVSDVERMGEWSPENIGAEWQEGATGAVGDRLIGHNRRGNVQWSVLCEVVVAEPGVMFEFVTRPDIGPCVRWTYRLEPTPSGTRVTEVWDVMQLPPSLEGRTREQLDERTAVVEQGMATTLERMKVHLET